LNFKLSLIFLIFLGGCATTGSNYQGSAVDRVVGMKEEKLRDEDAIQRSVNQNQYTFFWQRFSF
jgi:hypothetical protein